MRRSAFSTLRHLGAAMTASLVLALPTLAQACPQCAGNQQSTDLFWWILGSMILLPFPVVGAVMYAIRRGNQLEGELQPTPAEASGGLREGVRP